MYARIHGLSQGVKSVMRRGGGGGAPLQTRPKMKISERAVSNYLATFTLSIGVKS